MSSKGAKSVGRGGGWTHEKRCSKCNGILTTKFGHVVHAATNKRECP